jgi:hypothetical protein
MSVGTLEKRHFARVPCRLPVKYHLRGRAAFSNVLSDDISINGISFSNDKFIAPNTYVGFEISIFSTMLTPIGRVVWVNRLAYTPRYRVGVEFIELGQGGRNYLGDYIAMQTDKLV